MSVKLPRQVQEAEDRANEAIRTVQESQSGKPPEPAPAPAAEIPPPAPPPTNPPEERTDWKAKYHVLQGKYNAEVPRLSTEIRELKEQVQALTEKAAKAADAPPAPPKPAPPPAFDPADVERFGEDTVRMVRRYVDEGIGEVRNDLAPVKTKVDEVATQTESVATNQANAARIAFMADLTKLVPDWRETDHDDEWKAFLADNAPLTRIPRQKLLEEAYGAGDVEAVANFFKTFKATKVPLDPAPQAPSRSALESQVVPDPSGSMPSGGEKKIWTRAEIEWVGTQRVKGKLTEERYQALKADIDAAQREGRIR